MRVIGIVVIGLMLSGCLMGCGTQFGTALNAAGLLLPTPVAGEDGTDGIDGTNGVDGDRGVDGLVGADGLEGDTGAQGPQGDKGDRGTTGSDGTDGGPGADGDDGSDGADGRDGQDGTCDCTPGCHYHEIIDTGDPHESVTGPAIPCEEE